MKREREVRLKRVLAALRRLHPPVRCLASSCVCDRTSVFSTVSTAASLLAACLRAELTASVASFFARSPKFGSGASTSDPNDANNASYSDLTRVTTASVSERSQAGSTGANDRLRCLLVPGAVSYTHLTLPTKA